MQSLDEGSLKEKKVLFFAPAFFGYENKIKEKMVELGAEVDFYDERSVKSALSRAMLKISPNIFYLKSKQYYKRIIDENQKVYDYIFLIKGDMVPIKSLLEMKKKFRDAKTVLYLYDSIKNVPCIKKKLPYFDIKYTFDRKDCIKYPGLKFRPLFFLDEFRKENLEDSVYKYDISFCGTSHSDRYKIIKKIKKICVLNHYSFYWFGYLQSKFMYYYYKFLKSEYRGTSSEMFKFNKMGSEEIAQIVDSSRCVLDIQHPKQSGLTMRTIEMIGMQKKIITTNKEIETYDFYCPDNICVIDRKNINIKPDFLFSEYKTLEESIYEKYSLKSWVLEVLEVK